MGAEEPLSLRRPLHPQDPALPMRKDAVHTYACLIATFKLRGTFLCKTKPSNYTLVLCRRTWALRSPCPDEIPEMQPLPWTSCLEEAKQCYIASLEHIIRDGARGRGHADFGRNSPFLEGSAITMCWEQLPHGALGKGTSSWRCTPAQDLSCGSGEGWISNCSIPASTPCVEPLRAAPWASSPPRSRAGWRGSLEGDAILQGPRATGPRGWLSCFFPIPKAGPGSWPWAFPALG